MIGVAAKNWLQSHFWLREAIFNFNFTRAKNLQDLVRNLPPSVILLALAPARESRGKRKYHNFSAKA